MTEEWRDIPGYNGSYQVSDRGRVRSLPREAKHPTGTCRLKGRILKHFFAAFGYHEVGLQGKTFRVHTLVATAFLGPKPKGHETRHGANGIDDNSAANLSYGTRQQNALDQRRDGTHGGSPVIRSDGKRFINITVAAEQTGCSRPNISHVLTGKRKAAGGFGWAYDVEGVLLPSHPTTVRNRKPVTNGSEIFESSLAASKVTGAAQSAISSCCNGKAKTAGGSTWRFV
jgi:hypothetical protein